MIREPKNNEVVSRSSETMTAGLGLPYYKLYSLLSAQFVKIAVSVLNAAGADRVLRNGSGRKPGAEDNGETKIKFRAECFVRADDTIVI